MTSHFKRNDEEGRWEFTTKIAGLYISDALLNNEFADTLQMLEKYRDEALLSLNNYYDELKIELEEIINDRNPN